MKHLQLSIAAGGISFFLGSLVLLGLDETSDKVPQFITKWGVASIKMGPGFDGTDLNGQYLHLFIIHSPDSLNSHESGEMKSVEHIWVPPDRILTDWILEENEKGRYKTFFGVFPSDQFFVSGCGVETWFDAGDGELLDGYFYVCDCYDIAAQVQEFPEIEATASSQNTLSITWSPIAGVDDCGAIIWSQQPTIAGFFEGIEFSAAFRAENLPTVVDTDLSGNREYHLAVWARNIDPPEDSCGLNVQPFYVMDLKHFGGGPTPVEDFSWGRVKSSQ